MKKRLLLELAYDGGPWSGFARQTNALTVAEKLEDALGVIDPQASKVTAASRTDAGVHARHQIVSFTTEKQILSRGWVLALDRQLPDSISPVAISEVPMNFDPRIDPLWKRYRYRVFQSSVADPFMKGRSWRVHQALDIEAMRAEAQALEGTHDFAAFRRIDDHRKETERTLHRVRVIQAPENPRVVDIEVQGNRFMYNMVRIIAGTLVDVARGLRPQGSVERALASKDREDLGMTAPPEGLYLEHVELRTRGEKRWPPRA